MRIFFFSVGNYGLPRGRLAATVSRLKRAEVNRLKCAEVKRLTCTEVKRLASVA